MQKAFLETNAICRFFDDEISGKEIRAILSCHGYQPVIGFHVIYELARTFISGDDDETAKNSFEIVRDLNPDISEEPGVVLEREFAKYLTGYEFDCFLRGAKEAKTRREILKLSNGIFDNEARRFITSRDEKFRENHIAIGQRNVQMFLDDPPGNKLRSFDDVLNYYERDMPKMIEQLLKGIASPNQALDMANRIDDFPSLRSTVMANYYTLFVAVVHKNTPATDKIDDHRHVIDASYCDVFVTEDKQLLSNIRKINPGLKPIKWSTLGKNVGLSKA